MEFITIQKYIRTSPRKLQLVAGMIKRLTPAEAVLRLPFSGKRASEPLIKAISTAIANAKQKGVTESELTFKEIQINQGPKMKRWQAGSRGRAKPYARIMSHIRVVLETKAVETKKIDKVKAGKKVEKPISDTLQSTADTGKTLKSVGKETEAGREKAKNK